MQFSLEDLIGPFAKTDSWKLKVVLPMILAALCLFAVTNLIVKVRKPPGGCLPLILGTAIGELWILKKDPQCLQLSYRQSCKRKAKIDEKAVEGSSQSGLFSASANGVIGSLYEGITGRCHDSSSKINPRTFLRA